MAKQQPLPPHRRQTLSRFPQIPDRLVTPTTEALTGKVFHGKGLTTLPPFRVDTSGFTVNASVTSRTDKIAGVFIFPLDTKQTMGSMTIPVPGKNSTLVPSGPGQFYIMVQCYAPDCDWTIQIP